MPRSDPALPTLEFASAEALRDWLTANHATAPGIWLRVYKKGAGVPSVTFEEVLDAGLCFGWSESQRRAGDARSYLQRFTPRRTIGTTSQRNLDRAARLIAAGQMTPAGLKALGLDRAK